MTTHEFEADSHDCIRARCKERRHEGRLRSIHFATRRSTMSEFGRLWRGIERVARTRYPGFIVGLPLSSREIPVFTYHDVESASFARDLDFMRDNGYRTIGLDEYLGVRSGKYRNAPR